VVRREEFPVNSAYALVDWQVIHGEGALDTDHVYFWLLRVSFLHGVVTERLISVRHVFAPDQTKIMPVSPTFTARVSNVEKIRQRICNLAWASVKSKSISTSPAIYTAFKRVIL
jgi:hypothetical protein